MMKLETMMRRWRCAVWAGAVVVMLAVVVGGCSLRRGGAVEVGQVRPGTAVQRHGDEIVAAGQMFRIGTPVVLWMDPGGYDAYRVERRFAPLEESDWRTSEEQVEHLRRPNRYGTREHNMTEEQMEQVRGGGWPLELLQEVVDQFVIHYDVAGTAQRCFYILHDRRGLSVHFLLDLDGTIYQTLDLKERAWHATKANGRSIGIEIANMGSRAVGGTDSLEQWYGQDEEGRTIITIPGQFGDGGIRTPNFVGRPMRDDPVYGEVQGTLRRQYDFTPEQYEALIRLTAGLAAVFPKIELDYPRDEEGKLITRTLSDEEFEAFAGVLGHYHVQTNKNDPGPAFQWDLVIDGARELMEK